MAATRVSLSSSTTRSQTTGAWTDLRPCPSAIGVHVKFSPVESPKPSCQPVSSQSTSLERVLSPVPFGAAGSQEGRVFCDDGVSARHDGEDEAFGEGEEGNSG